tara:strand:- start:21556 stop:22341 length:786 start_codon:yes stop_codon:yes gene_type:complete
MFLKSLLSVNAVRFRVIRILKKHFYQDLGISIPVNANLWADLVANDSFDSFSEIFIKQEYEDYLPNETPLSVVDIGANYGFFSLWLQSKHPEKKIRSLLIEASPSCCGSIEKLIQQNNLRNQFSYLNAAIGPNSIAEVEFFDRSFMAGSTIPQEGNMKEKSLRISCVDEEEIISLAKSPVDLIKCDIEGSEWEFLSHYRKLITSAKYLLLEWHSWHNGGGGFNQIRNELEEIDFEIEKCSSAEPAVGKDGQVGLILAKSKL